jgi:hypothetical protein
MYNNSIINQAELEELHHGSYGQIYISPTNPYRVLKEPIDPAKCHKWEHEYEMHVALYNTLNAQLESAGISIVKPYKFLYGERHGKQITLLKTATHANTCFYIMERVPGYTQKHQTALHRLRKSTAPPLRQEKYPPFLFLGSMDIEERYAPHITLPSLIGASVHTSGFFCDIAPNSPASTLLTTMFHSFFEFLGAGYMPRDIEWVFNGKNRNTPIRILDFNQVRSLNDRKPNKGPYNLQEDIAQVYIDLCGLRHGSDIGNPQFREPPTPDWKFLCNPLIAPNAFLALVRKMPAAFTENIFQYVTAWYFKQVSFHEPDLYLWRPTSLYYTSGAPPPNSRIVGNYTIREYMKYRASLRHFSVKEGHYQYPKDDTHYTFYIHADRVADRVADRDAPIFDIWLEFDIALQQYYVMKQLEMRDADAGALTGLTFEKAMAAYMAAPKRSLAIADVNFADPMGLWSTEATVQTAVI